MKYYINIFFGPYSSKHMGIIQLLERCVTCDILNNTRVDVYNCINNTSTPFAISLFTGYLTGHLSDGSQPTGNLSML